MDIIYEDEPIKKKRGRPRKLPELLARARQVGEDMIWESPHKVFLKQGKLLADYEDDYEFTGDPVRYYPTYQSLDDSELRGYFTWRTKARKDIFEDTPLTFIFLYVYELINQIGVTDPFDGFEKLLKIFQHYAIKEPALNHYLQVWLKDYIIYYDLSKELLDYGGASSKENAVRILENIADKKTSDIIGAVRQLAPKWLNRSRFYAAHQKDMDEIISRVLKGMAARYDKTCIRRLPDQLFGSLSSHYYPIFSQAVFCNPLSRKRKNYTYELDEDYYYQCQSGIWMFYRRSFSSHSARKLENLLKTIDAHMRVEYGDKHPVKAETGTKWINKLILESIHNFQKEKTLTEKPVISIDFSRLDKIRSDAVITRERLIQEEESLEATLEEASPTTRDLTPASGNATLNDEEKRLLHCLLYGESLDWVRKEGLFLSVLVDKINTKMFDLFGDTVLDDSPAILEDYIDELKEMFPA